MRVGFDNTCTVSGKWNVSRVIPGLHGWVYKNLRLFPLVVEHSVVVLTADSHSRRLQMGRGRKSYFWPTKITSFSSLDSSRSNKHDTFWHVVLTRYFHVLILWAIAVLDFRPLEIYKNYAFPCLLSLLQSTVIQTTIYLLQILCSVK